jgi:hypothetical protein
VRKDRERDREREREGGERRTLWIEFQNCGTTIQMRLTSIEERRNYLSFVRHWTRYHITVCQVSTATQAVYWLTEMLSFRKSWFYVPRRKSIILNLIVSLQSLLRQFFVPDTSNSYEIIIAKWRDECGEHKNNPALVFIHKLAVTVNFSSYQPVWCWLTFLPIKRNSSSWILFIVFTSAQ